MQQVLPTDGKRPALIAVRPGATLDGWHGPTRETDGALAQLEGDAGHSNKCC